MSPGRTQLPELRESSPRPSGAVTRLPERRRVRVFAFLLQLGVGPGGVSFPGSFIRSQFEAPEQSCQLPKFFKNIILMPRPLARVPFVTAF